MQITENVIQTSPTSKVSIDDNANYRSFLTLSHNQFEHITTLNDKVLAFLPQYTRYASMCLNEFSWDIPDRYEQIRSDFIEKLLYYKGRCALVNADNMGLIVCDFIVTKYNGYSMFNMFGEPQEIDAIDIFNNNKVIGHYTSDDFVIISDNPMWYPTNLTVWQYSTDIANINLAITRNIQQQRFPVVFQGTSKQRQTFEQMCKKIDNDDIYIFLDKDVNIDDITKLSIDAHFIAKELYDVKDRKDSDLLTMIGLANVNTVKQSGISADEINSNNQGIELTFDTKYSSRLKAVDEIKKKFDIDMTVSVNPVIKTDDVYVEDPDEDELTIEEVDE